jgi:hypothetical protein
MKTNNKKKEVQKFGLEKFEIAKLKNLHLIIGGGIDPEDDPIDTNHQKGDSSDKCKPPQ